MSCQGVKVGDIIIGNSLANNEHIYTREGWIGIITNISPLGPITAKGKYPNEEKEREYIINPECFDFVLRLTAPKLAEELGFKMEGIL